MSFSVIKSFLTLIIKSDTEKAVFKFNKSGKAYYLKIASFSLIVIAMSSFKDLIIGIIEDILIEVYFRAVQHLFLSL